MYDHIYILRFPKETYEQPFIYQLVKKFDVEVNIMKAEIIPQREGLMILRLKGTKAKVREGLDFLSSSGVNVERLAANIHRDEEKCFQCGACTGICPVEALFIDRETMAVLFEPEKCTGCSLCVPICPVGAMEVSLGATDILVEV